MSTVSNWQELASRTPTLADIRYAAETIEDLIVQTPLLESAWLNDHVEGRVLLKAETLQKTGAFKYRGASFFISMLDEDTRSKGVVAYSSGNHAQAVAAAAKHFGIPATIVMPQDAPKMKIDNTRAYGARVILYDRYTESREAIGEAVAVETGATLIPPYDHPLTITGQGTVGLEFMEQAQALGAHLDAVLVPCSGGGLAAGVAIAVTSLSSATQVYSVEPEGFDDTRRSLLEGEPVQNDAGHTTLCDALMMPQPGHVTFPLNRYLLTSGLAVSDAEVAQAMQLAFDRLKLVVEPGGAVALAAVLSGKMDCTGKTVGVVLSGGNVDPETFAACLQR